MNLIKTPQQIELMRKSGKILAETLALVKKHAKAGVAGEGLDKIAHDFIVSHGAKPTFLGYRDYPASICLSINEGIVHGIPEKVIIKEGDVVKVDIGVNYKGWNTDAAITVLVDPINPDHRQLLDTAEEALKAGIAKVRDGIHLGDVQAAIENVIRKKNYGLVTDLTGHGIGQNLHEPPSIPNYGKIGEGMILKSGMTTCLEPMITLGSGDIETLNDGWTIVSIDRSVAVHVEHTILVTDNGSEILTQSI